MTVERSSFISQLDEQNPKSFDLLKEGDDHIRLIKSNLRNNFPKFDRKVDFSAEQLNKLYGWIMAIEDAEDPEALSKFTVLKDAEIRGDLFFTEGGVDGTDSSTPDSPRISGLSEIQFTTDENNLEDPSELPAEKKSRAITLGTADKRYIALKDKDGMTNGVAKLRYADKDVAVATEGVLTVNGKLVANELEGPAKEKFQLNMDTGIMTLQECNVNTNLRVTGNIFRGSDERIKFHINDLASDLTVDNLRPVKYKKQGVWEYGVIAQEVLEHAPEHAHIVDKDIHTGFHSVDYTQMIPLLLKEIKDLKSKVSTLEGLIPREV